MYRNYVRVELQYLDTWKSQLPRDTEIHENRMRYIKDVEKEMKYVDYFCSPNKFNLGNTYVTHIMYIRFIVPCTGDNFFKQIIFL